MSEGQALQGDPNRSWRPVRLVLQLVPDAVARWLLAAAALWAWAARAAGFDCR